MPESVSRAVSIALLPPLKRAAFLRRLSEDDLETFEHNWPWWARANQLPPPGDWQTWLLLAGRGFGKTRTGAEYVRDQIRNHGRRRVALVAPTAADARDVMVEGESGILSIGLPQERPHYEPSKRRLTWPNGAIATTYSADEPERLRGPQHDAAWCFIAGTLIAVPDDAEVPVERISSDTLVVTRKGTRRVLAVSSRTSVVGRVRFSNGVELVGSPEHPIFTSHGVITMMSLHHGDIVCVGPSRQTATLPPILLAAKHTNTDGFGNKLTARFLKIARSITWMATQLITQSIIWSWCSPKSTEQLTRRARLTPEPWNALIADGSSYASIRSSHLSAHDVNAAEQTNDAQLGDGARSAGAASTQFADTSVASVVSTWERVGEARVYNLRVEGEAEYFANGILVHNCDEIASWRYPEAWDMLMFGLRLGIDPRVVVTTTPKPIKIIRELIADPTTVITRGSTYDNRANLAPAFLHQIVK
jgi:hypothetical protein